jgi:ABC-type transport system substrate-binding protein/serine/threonine protein kinase
MSPSDDRMPPPEDTMTVSPNDFPPNPGQWPEIDGYDILEPEGEGAQGEVFRALHRATGKEVAVKVVRTGWMAGPTAMAQFTHEADVIARLDHPNVVPILDRGCTRAGVPFCSMALVRGDTIDKHIARKRLSYKQRLDLFCRLCRAVAYIHQRGIIHRDLKPSNTKISEHDQPVLLDFGLARWLLQPPGRSRGLDGPAGTPAYMAPEAIDCLPGEIDARADTYALGVIVYEMLTGDLPYSLAGKGLTQIFEIIRGEPPAPARKKWSAERGAPALEPRWWLFQRSCCPIDGRMERILMKALVKQPDARYQTADALSTDIRNYLEVRPTLPDLHRPWSVFWLWLRRNRRKLCTAGAAVLALLAGASWYRDSLQDRWRADADRLVARANLILGQQPDQAKAYYEQALQLDADNTGAHLGLGLVTVQAGLQETLEHKAEVLKAALQHFRAAHEAAEGIWPEPAWPCDESSPALPGSADALICAAQAYYRLGETKYSSKLLCLAERMRAQEPAIGDRTPLSLVPKAYALAADPLIDRPVSSGFRPGMRDDATIHRALRERPGSLHPLKSSPDAVTELLFDRLFYLAAPEPASASSMEADMTCEANLAVLQEEPMIDGTVVQIRLRPDAKWHDDRPLTAEDVVFSWQQLPEDWLARTEILSVETSPADDSIVRFSFDRDTAEPCWILQTIVLLPRYWLDLVPEQPDSITRNSDFRWRPIGSGPYTIHDRTDWQLILRRWDEYPGEAPPIKEVVFQAYPSGARLLEDLAAGKLDEVELNDAQFTWDVNGASFASEHTAVRKVHEPSWRYDCIVWNTRRPGFEDPRVRTALAHAVALDALLAQGHGQLYERCTGIYYPGVEWASPHVLPLASDPSLADELLDEAGWPRGADGLRWKNGQCLKFDLLVPVESIESLPAMTEIAAQLQARGVRLDVETLPWNDFCVRRDAKDAAGLPDPEFDAALITVWNHADPGRAVARYGSRKPWNYGSYTNPNVDELFGQAASEPDEQKRFKLYQQIHELVYEDQPCLFLWHRPSLWALNQRLQNVQFTELGPVGIYPGARAWWVRSSR